MSHFGQNKWRWSREKVLGNLPFIFSTPCDYETVLTQIKQCFRLAVGWHGAMQLTLKLLLKTRVLLRWQKQQLKLSWESVNSWNISNTHNGDKYDTFAWIAGLDTRNEPYYDIYVVEIGSMCVCLCICDCVCVCAFVIVCVFGLHVILVKIQSKYFKCDGCDSFTHSKPANRPSWTRK